MSKSKLKLGFIAGLVICGVLAFLFGQSQGFESRWRGVKDGMTQAEIRHLLGTPTQIGDGSYIGAGNKPVAHWEYRRRHMGRIVHYWVDFDFIGPDGIPVVYRTERLAEEWEWPSWCPWYRPKARA